MPIGLFKRILPVLEAIGHLSVIGGIIFVALEFVGQQADKRERNALDFLQAFYDPKITDARFRLQAYWFAQPLAQLSGRPGSAGVVDDLALAQIFPPKSDPRITDLLRVVEQLDVIGTCVKTETCDRQIVVDQIGGYVENLLCLYQAPLMRLRTDYALPDLGQAAATVIEGGLSCRRSG